MPGPHLQRFCIGQSGVGLGFCSSVSQLALLCSQDWELGEAVASGTGPVCALWVHESVWVCFLGRLEPWETFMA